MNRSDVLNRWLAELKKEKGKIDSALDTLEDQLEEAATRLSIVRAYESGYMGDVAAALRQQIETIEQEQLKANQDRENVNALIRRIVDAGGRSF